jgi:RND family efflux transporter MFP subunit
VVPSPSMIRVIAVLLAGLAGAGTVHGETATTQPSRSESARAEPRYSVTERVVDDLKSVFATVRSKDLTEARVRTPGTIVELGVDEGDEVRAGQRLALVTDPKIALRLKAVDAQMKGLESRIETARRDYERALQLRERGVAPEARVDQLKTALDVAENELKTLRSERLVLEQQASEGEVLAPAEGRVIKVPFTTGSVVMAGESIATIAANEFLLRLEVPERHARFMKPGDTVKLGERGLASRDIASEGRIVQVYPELEGGRVIADAEAPGLGDYFVGERALVWISAGRRRVIVVPDSFIFRRFGLDQVLLERPDGRRIAIVVQLGRPLPTADGKPGHEVLAGLEAGDTIVRDEAAQAHE